MLELKRGGRTLVQKEIVEFLTPCRSLPQKLKFFGHFTSQSRRDGKEMYKKTVTHVQSCCFANQTHCFWTLPWPWPSPSQFRKVPSLAKTRSRMMTAITFSRQSDDWFTQEHQNQYRENLVPVVVLFSESKALYCSLSKWFLLTVQEKKRVKIQPTLPTVKAEVNTIVDNTQRPLSVHFFFAMQAHLSHKWNLVVFIKLLKIFWFGVLSLMLKETIQN